VSNTTKHCPFASVPYEVTSHPSDARWVTLGWVACNRDREGNPLPGAQCLGADCAVWDSDEGRCGIIAKP